MGFLGFVFFFFFWSATVAKCPLNCPEVASLGAASNRAQSHGSFIQRNDDASPLWPFQMLRFLIGSLFISSVKRAVCTPSHHVLHNLAISSTYRTYHIMQQPQQPVEMVTEETMPACPGNPSDSSEPQKKEQTLPKLTPQEFKIYNRMAEHMNYFVRLAPLSYFSPPSLPLPLF